MEPYCFPASVSNTCSSIDKIILIKVLFKFHVVIYFLPSFSPSHIQKTNSWHAIMIGNGSLVMLQLMALAIDWWLILLTLKQYIKKIPHTINRNVIITFIYKKISSCKKYYAYDKNILFDFFHSNWKMSTMIQRSSLEQMSE